MTRALKKNQVGPEASKTYPSCTTGAALVLPEDCGRPACFMAERNGLPSLDALEDLDTITEIIG